MLACRRCSLGVAAACGAGGKVRGSGVPQEGGFLETGNGPWAEGQVLSLPLQPRSPCP